MDEESSQQFFNLAMVVVVLGLVFAMMGGCVALGLSDAKDGTAEFWRGLERQSGGGSP